MLSSLPAETAFPQHKRRSIKGMKVLGTPNLEPPSSCLSSLTSNPSAFFGPAWSPSSSPASTVRSSLPLDADQPGSPGSSRAESLRKGKAFSSTTGKATRSYVHEEEGRATTPQKHRTHGGAVNDRRKLSFEGLSKGLLRLLGHRTLSDDSSKTGPKTGKQDAPKAKVVFPGDRSEEDREPDEAPSTDSVTDERRQPPFGGGDEAEVALPGDRSEEYKESREAPSMDTITDEECQLPSDGGDALPGDLSEQDEESSEAPSTDSVTDDERFQLPSRGGDEVPHQVRSPLVVGPSKRVAAEEADVENCRSATIDPRAVEIAAPSTAELAKAAVMPDNLVRQAAEQGLVLPCGPSDEEKVLYHKSGRLTMLSTGFVSFCTLLTGMSLFTMSSPHFYWYGAPTIFVVVHICCHYFGVSIWGRDFDPEIHACVVRHGLDVAFSPTVDVFLPVCNEPAVLLANTWNHVRAMDYPHVTVHVLDDGAKDEVKALAGEYGFQYIRRDNRPELKKAGNLRHAFARTSGEVIVIFDADFCPRPDFLRETLPYLVDPSIGILQTPQFFRRREEQTWVEQGAGASQEHFYRLIQVNLDRFNAAVCVGSCGLYRRTAVEPFGGVAPIEHSEDMYTGYKMTELGYKVRYLPLCLAMGICPDEPRSFFMQQYRWCMGTSTLVLQKEFWQSEISKTHKLCFFNGMLFYLATALFVFLGPMPILLLIWMKADEVLWFYYGFTIPALIYSLIVVPTWSKQDSILKALTAQRIKVIQSYAHLFAIKDRLMGTVAAWVPSGGGASKASSKAYDNSVRVLVTWNVVSTILIVGGAIWMATVHPWYHFAAPVVLTMSTCCLSLSTLWY
ncbi:unnamed protein product [Ectocarpus sp. 6 AP-2014]